MADAAAKPVADYPVFLEFEDDAYEAVERLAIADVRDALVIVEKAPREARLDDIKATVVAELAANLRSSAVVIESDHSADEINSISDTSNSIRKSIFDECGSL